MSTTTYCSWLISTSVIYLHLLLLLSWKVFFDIIIKIVVVIVSYSISTADFVQILLRLLRILVESRFVELIITTLVSKLKTRFIFSLYLLQKILSLSKMCFSFPNIERNVLLLESS